MRYFKRLEHYGIIGNLSTCALVGKDGSIDWCCFPHIESPSIFGSILDLEKGGHFSIRAPGSFRSEHNYLGETNVLETVFETSSGILRLTDFMPIKEQRGIKNLIHQSIFRKIVCDKGSVDFEVDFRPRFNYGQAKTFLEPTKKGIRASTITEEAYLFCPFDLLVKSSRASGFLNLEKGNTVWMVLQYGHGKLLSSEECEKYLETTIRYWNEWRHRCETSKCVFGGPWHELVTRSGLILKLLTHEETGAICAAPTTSLPEEIGGVRNWDYRFNWIRDASFTVQALYNLGHIKEAKRFLNWIMSICRDSTHPSEIQIMYGMHGELDLEEQEINYLSGYRNSRPVRIGNGAAKQKQLDIYGELINAVYETSRYGEEVSTEVWDFVKRINDYVCEVWDTPDSGIWEFRGKPQHFVYSKLMCWIALDRGVKMARLRNIGPSVIKWENMREQIRKAILERGFNQKLNSFVQAFDSEILDATSLLIPMMGFLPFYDSRIQGTINAVLKHLTTQEGLVYRYLGEDGLPGKEGVFSLCSFWLVNVLALSGRIKEAEKIFRNILKYVSPLGLLAEEINPDTGKQLGNFPQAFSHIGLINSALYLGRAKGKKQMGPEPLGEEEIWE